MTDTSNEEVERYQTYGGAGKLPTECCEYSVVDNEAGKEICRVWDVEDARKISFILNRCTERDRVVSKLQAQLKVARDALERIQGHYTDTDLAPLHMQGIARAALKSIESGENQ